ncbi:MAG: hypothetical protein IJO70_12110 [Lachnospiraceae bacterium]|nr:hypothetical protein [Lachnospiraceae bacterium]
MDWHFLNKTIFRKIAMLLSGIMVAALWCGANLIDSKGITGGGEINHFIENILIMEIRIPYNILFCILIAVGMVLFLIGWKWYEKKHRAGVLLNNIATGYLATVFLGYGLTCVLVLRAFSWAVVYSFAVSVVLYAMLAVNIASRLKTVETDKTENRDAKEATKEETDDLAVTDRSYNLAVVSTVVALLITALFVGIFIHIYNSINNESYREYKKDYELNSYAFLGGEPDYKDYVRLQFVNYFNQDGEHFTYEELEESIDNFYNDSGSWYALWYCISFVDDSRRPRYNAMNFRAYGYNDAPHKGYLNFVQNQLIADGINPAETTHEELDAACKQVYEVYTQKTPVIVLGDDDGEIVIHINIPESGDVDEVEVTWENQGYYAYVTYWYEVSAVGQGQSKDAEPVEVLEEGKIYYTNVYYNFAIPYVSSDMPTVQLDVTGGKLLNDKLSYREPVDIWVTPGSTN